MKQGSTNLIKQEEPMPQDRSLSNSTVTAIIHAPIETVNIADWLFTLPDAEYQRCSRAHIAAGITTTDDGRPMSINVETIGDALIVQHYIAEVKEPTLCRMVSISDAINKNGRTKVKVEWTLSAKKIDDRTSEYSNYIHASATDEFLAFIKEHGITLPQAAAARQAASDAHNHEETPNFAASIQRHATRSNVLSTTTEKSSTQHPRILILVTSANKFADGRPTGIWLEEFATPYNALVHAGARVTVVSPKGGQVPIDPRSVAKPEQEAEWKKAEEALHSTVLLDPSVHATDYDAIFIPGGHGPLFDLAVDPSVAALISEFARAGKPIASVCHGPAALLGVTLADGKPFVQGRKLTAFSDAEEKAVGLEHEVPFSVQEKLISLGAQYSEGPNFGAYTVVDGTLITGQNPRSSGDVARLLLDRLQK
jgi:putative intracellular protease/amidase